MHILIFLCLAHLTYLTNSTHPSHLTRIGHGLFVAGVHRVDHANRPTSSSRSLKAFQADKLSFNGLGAYAINVNISGLRISAVLDSGSGMSIIACKGEAENESWVSTFPVFLIGLLHTVYKSTGSYRFHLPEPKYVAAMRFAASCTGFFHTNKILSCLDQGPKPTPH